MYVVSWERLHNPADCLQLKNFLHYFSYICPIKKRLEARTVKVVWPQTDGILRSFQVQAGLRG